MYFKERKTDMYFKEAVDGYVSVLVSPGFGGGWSSHFGHYRSEIQEQLCMDSVLVQMCREGATEEEVSAYVMEIVNEPEDVFYLPSGWNQCEIVQVELGKQFYIEEYDGYESLTLLDDISMTA